MVAQIWKVMADKVGASIITAIVLGVGALGLGVASNWTVSQVRSVVQDELKKNSSPWERDEKQVRQQIETNNNIAIAAEKKAEAARDGIVQIQIGQNEMKTSFNEFKADTRDTNAKILQEIGKIQREHEGGVK